jgi:hypothetical protein
MPEFYRILINCSELDTCRPSYKYLRRRHTSNILYSFFFAIKNLKGLLQVCFYIYLVLYNSFNYG